MILLGTGLLQRLLKFYNICLPVAATVEKMVILAKSVHYTATVVNGGEKS